MTSPEEGNSGILFHNQGNTVFLVDIPYSIAQAQELTPAASESKLEKTSPIANPGLTSNKNKHRRSKNLLSALPLQAPYPSTEPKTESARAKVLERIPLGERRFHGDFIQSLVQSALQDIQAGYSSHGRQWCLSRYVSGNDRARRESGSRRSGHSVKKRGAEGLIELDSARESATSNAERSGCSWNKPPVILSSTCTNAFRSMSDLDGVVRNTSFESAVLTAGASQDDGLHPLSEYIIPPRSSFVLCTLPLSPPGPEASESLSLEKPIPGVPGHRRFNLILFDPPWPNRSVRRSGHYHIHPYFEMEVLTQRLRDILRVHSYRQPGDAPIENQAKCAGSDDLQTQSQESLAAIWITNAEKSRRTAYEALTSTGFRICEEWVWIKTTADGQPISPLDGLWRKPYEILVIGRKDRTAVVADGFHESLSPENDLLGIDPASVKRRVIAAVPDLHSRKPNLKAVFENVFFQSHLLGQAVESYSALEVFARGLTAGWWACGNEVLKFNARECWVEDE